MSKDSIRRLISTRPLAAARQIFTATEATRTASPPEEGHNTLRSRLSTLQGNSPPGSVKKALNDYIMERNSPSKLQLIKHVKELRKFKRFHHALEMMEWMEIRKMKFGYTDHAVRMDLISKTQGISAAEKYLEHLTPAQKNQMTYGSLLNCYCKELMREKALHLFRKMDELGFLNSSLPFNNLMTMCLRLGQPRKVVELVQVMKRRKVFLDTYTCNMWMQACASLNDFEGVECILEEVEKGDGDDLKCDWTTYSNLATIYIKAGELGKVESALKRLEAEIGPNNREAYHFLISLYAGISKLSEVLRVWNLLKSKFHVTTNLSYLELIMALARLNDVEGITKWFNEWESCCRSYDHRIAYQVMKAYLDHDMYEKAVLVFEGATKRCGRISPKAGELFMVYSLRLRQLDRALEYLKMVLSECAEVGVEWRPKQETVDAFFNYFEEEKNVDGAEMFCKILKNNNYVDSNGKADTSMHQLLEENGIEIRPEPESSLK